MIQEGHVRVVWINSSDTIATPRYTITFACYEPPEEFDAQKSKAIIGEAELLRFLYVINVDADVAANRHPGQVGYPEDLSSSSRWSCFTEEVSSWAKTTG